MKPITCWECDQPMHLIQTKFHNISCEAWRCSICKETIFTEKQSLFLARAIDQEHMKDMYPKSAIKIGSSWGITFPKAVVDAFKLNQKKTKMKIHPQVAEGKIVIEVEG
jgi:hypothetical protein